MYLFILHELGKDTRGFHGSLVVTIIEWIPPPHAFFSFFAGTTCVLNNVTIHSFQTLQFLFQIQFTNHTPFLSFFFSPPPTFYSFSLFFQCVESALRKYLQSNHKIYSQDGFQYSFLTNLLEIHKTFCFHCFFYIYVPTYSFFSKK